jgi:hypothetical protein
MPSSSSEEDLGRFASVAVTGNAISDGAKEIEQVGRPPPLPPPPLAAAATAECHHLAPAIAQKAKERRHKVARRRLGGANSSDDDDGLVGPFDAAARRVAEALQRRLDRDLAEDSGADEAAAEEPEAAPAPAAAALEGAMEPEPAGIRLFRSSLTNARAEPAAAPPRRFQAPPELKRRALMGADAPGKGGDGALARRCAQAAVEVDALLAGAARAAAAAASRVAPVEPGSEDEGGRARQRRRRKDRELPMPQPALVIGARPFAPAPTKGVNKKARALSALERRAAAATAPPPSRRRR